MYRTIREQRNRRNRGKSQSNSLWNIWNAVALHGMHIYDRKVARAYDNDMHAFTVSPTSVLALTTLLLCRETCDPRRACLKAHAVPAGVITEADVAKDMLAGNALQVHKKLKVKQPVPALEEVRLVCNPQSKDQPQNELHVRHAYRRHVILSRRL